MTTTAAIEFDPFTNRTTTITRERSHGLDRRIRV